MEKQHSQFYGRYTGRMRGPRLAALEAALPRYAFALEADALSPRSLFTAPVDAVWMEIGFGGGEHLLEQARRHPTMGFIGCEPYRNGLSTLLQGIEAEQLTNIRVFTEDARFLLNALTPESIARCFILFADPWPKKRQAKRRIVNPETLDDMARILVPGGELRLATDSPDLAAWYEDVVPSHPAFSFAPAAETSQIRPEDWPVTRYEQKALDAHRKPYYYRAIRRSDCLLPKSPAGRI